MRRPAMYLAGMFLATGASLALAGPALAHDGDCKKNRGSAAGVIYADDYDRDRGYYDGDRYIHSNSWDLDYTRVDNNNQRTYGLINAFSGNNGNGLGDINVLGLLGGGKD